MRYVPGHKGPTLPGPGPRPAPVSTRPPGPAPTGPMTPVRGGGTLPKSLAVMSRQKMKKGGKVKCMAKGGSASKRADGIAAKGKTKGRII